MILRGVVKTQDPIPEWGIGTHYGTGFTYGDGDGQGTAYGYGDDDGSGAGVFTNDGYGYGFTEDVVDTRKS